MYKPIEQEMQSPLFSILLPIYNGEKFLNELFASIEKQTFRDFDVVICDDGSIDSSLALIRRWQSGSSLTISITTNQENLGVGLAQQANVKQFRGKYAVLAAQDHVWSERRLEQTYEAIEKFHADLVFSGFGVTSQDGRSLRKFVSSANFLPINPSTLLMFRSDLITLDTLVLKREFFTGFSDHLKFTPAEDIALALNAIKQSHRKKVTWACLNSPQIIKVRSENSLSSRYAEKLRDGYVELALKKAPKTWTRAFAIGSADVIFLSKSRFKNLVPNVLKMKKTDLFLGCQLVLARLILRTLGCILFKLSCLPRVKVGRIT